MKKVNEMWKYSFIFIGIALIVSGSCKKKEDPPAPQVPLFTVTADSVQLQSGGEGLQFFGKCANEDVKMTKVTVITPQPAHTATHLFNGASYVKNTPFGLQDDNTAYDKKLGTWSFTFEGNRTSDNAAFTVNATLTIALK